MTHPAATIRLLDDTDGVPLDRPFTWEEAGRLGVTARRLRSWVDQGLLAHPVQGVYHAVQLPDGLDLRLACLRLVVPEDAVVTDRTAGWLHGAEMILAPGDHRAVPRVSMFRAPGHRLRNPLVASGERAFEDCDVEEIQGVRVTTPLRTACDLGRLLHRDQALAALDALTRLGRFTVPELVAESGRRYRGARHVRQLRSLALLADPRAESPGESVLRLRWLDCGDLPRPVPQVPVRGPDGLCFLDLAVEGIRYAAEYDGEEWHGPEHREHDRRRRDWFRRNGGWEIDVLRRDDVHGRTQRSELILRAGVARAQRRWG